MELRLLHNALKTLPERLGFRRIEVSGKLEGLGSRSLDQGSGNIHGAHH